MSPIAPAAAPAGEHPAPAAPPRRRRRARRLVAAAGLALALAGSLAACGADTPGNEVASLSTGDGDDATTTTEAAPLTQEEIAEAQQAFQACMQEHGVDIQIAPVDPDGGRGGVVMRSEVGPDAPGAGDMPTQEEMEEANRECRPLMEKVIENAPKPDPEELERRKEQALAFAQCMRDNGVDMPDPQFSDDGGITQSVGGPGGEVDPDFEAASQACSELMRGPDGEVPPRAGGGPGGAVPGAPLPGGDG